LGDENFSRADVIFSKRRILGTAMDTCLESRHIKPSICDTINLIYQAALQPPLWSEILSDIRILCGADQCTLFFYDALEPSRRLVSAARTNEEALTHYLKNFIQQQAIQINNQLKSLPEGQVVTNQDVRQFAGEEYSKIVGAEYMQKFWPNLKFEAGIVLLRGDASCAGLGLQNFNDSLPLNSQGISLLQKLAPHLCQAMRLHQTLIEFENSNDSLKKVLHASKIGIILLDEKYAIQFINHKAKHSLEKIDDLPLTQQLALEKISKEQVNKIVTQFNGPAKSQSKNVHHSSDLQIVYKNGHLKINGYALQKSYLKKNDKHFSHIEEGYILIIQDSNPDCSLDPQYLHSAYEITATERKLILGLINGATLLDNADSQTVKPSTVRWHLKNIMQKTMTHSQTELTRLMLELRD